MSPFRRPPRQRGDHEDSAVGAEERYTLRQLAPMRRTLEQLLRQVHERNPRGVIEPELAADVERMWTVVLEAYRQGVETMTRGLHRAEGVDHEMISEAAEYGMRAVKRGK